MATKAPKVLTVNGSDPRWKSITKGDYVLVDSDLKVDHFPISNPDTREVEYEEIIFDHDPTFQEILDTIEQRGLCRPERDEAETYFDNVPDTKEQLGKSPIVALCGSIVKQNDYLYVANVYADDRGRDLHFNWIDIGWDRRLRYLAVRKTPV